METLEAYLQRKYTAATAKIYYRDALIYINQTENHRTATYQDILNYIEKLRKQYKNVATVNRMFYGAKAYCFYLLETGQRTDHPCRYLKLKDARPKDIQLQDLFTIEELEKLLERKERYNMATDRNKVIISLLIYQALRTGEITAITLDDINLEEGTIYIRASPRTAARTLKLKPGQIMLLYRYIHEIRPQAMKVPTQKLLLTLRGRPESGDGINYLIGALKHLYPERNLNPETVRQSVIANMLKEGKDLRVVQVFAGHKKASSTEKYKQTAVEELKAEIIKRHPLG